MGFGTLERQFDILRHSCEIGLLALALTPIIITAGIDLSVGSLLGLCAILFGSFWHDAGFSIPVAIPEGFDMKFIDDRILIPVQIVVQSRVRSHIRLGCK